MAGLCRAFAIGAILFIPLRVALAQGKLEIRFLDVGQADAILITCPDKDHHLLIDTADTRYPQSSKQFQNAMISTFPADQRSLTTVIASHPHQDHIGSMEWLLKNFVVKTYIDNGQKTDTVSFGRLEKLRRALTKSGKLKYIDGKKSSGADVDFCPELELHLLEPWASAAGLSDTNDRSVAVRLDFKEMSFLFVGDIEGEAEDAMLNKAPKAEREMLDVDVLKVGHHGSDTSSTAAFLNAVTPEVAVISCGHKDVGTNVGYKHPRASTVRRIVDLLKQNPKTDKIDVYDKDKETWVRQERRRGLWVTAADGEVTIRTDGHTLEVEHHEN